jgi:hypothetical protein
MSAMDDKFECIDRRGALGVHKLNSADADSETPRRHPHGTYVLHRTGCSQAEDQLLRQRWPWHETPTHAEKNQKRITPALLRRASGEVD